MASDIQANDAASDPQPTRRYAVQGDTVSPDPLDEARAAIVHVACDDRQTPSVRLARLEELGRLVLAQFASICCDYEEKGRNGQ